MMRSTTDDPPGGSDTGDPTTVASDEQLMAAYRGGSDKALGELFLRYKQPLFGFFRRRTADYSCAEELAQETFLAVVRGSTRYEPRALFRTYLYGIAFLILKAHRRQTTFRALFLGEKSGEPASKNTTDAEMVMRDAVGKLQSADREILLLREFEDLNYSEIAELLKLPVNTVRSRLFRARAALRKLLTAPAPAPSAKSFLESKERV
jgi:RNA polymerase sigma-70 factor (ECF subfamily)